MAERVGQTPASRRQYTWQANVFIRSIQPVYSDPRRQCSPTGRKDASGCLYAQSKILHTTHEPEAIQAPHIRWQI